MHRARTPRRLLAAALLVAAAGAGCNSNRLSPSQAEQALDLVSISSQVRSNLAALIHATARVESADSREVVRDAVVDELERAMPCEDPQRTVDDAVAIDDCVPSPITTSTGRDPGTQRRPAPGAITPCTLTTAPARSASDDGSEGPRLAAYFGRSDVDSPQTGFTHRGRTLYGVIGIEVLGSTREGLRLRYCVNALTDGHVRTNGEVRIARGTREPLRVSLTRERLSWRAVDGTERYKGCGTGQQTWDPERPDTFRTGRAVRRWTRRRCEGNLDCEANLLECEDTEQSSRLDWHLEAEQAVVRDVRDEPIPQDGLHQLIRPDLSRIEVDYARPVPDGPVDVLVRGGERRFGFEVSMEEP